MGWNAAEVYADDEEGVEDELFERLQYRKETGQIVVRSEQIEVAKKHARNEHGTEPAIRNIHKVKDEPYFTPESGIPCASREC